MAELTDRVHTSLGTRWERGGGALGEYKVRWQVRMQFHPLAVWFMMVYSGIFSVALRKVEFWYCKALASQDKISDVTHVIT